MAPQQNDPWAGIPLDNSPAQAPGYDPWQGIPGLEDDPLAHPDQLSYADVVRLDRQNEVDNVNKLTEILHKPGTTPDQQQRIQRLIKVYTDPLTYNRVTDRERNVFSNFVLGAAHGALDYGLLGMTDLALAAVELPFSVASAVSTQVGGPNLRPDSIESVRKTVQDAQVTAKDLLDPQGAAGAAGTLVGALNPWTGGATWGRLGAAATTGLGKVVPGAAAIIERGAKPGALYWERLAAQAVGNAGVDAIAIMDVATNPNLDDKGKAIAIQSLLSLAGSAAFAGKPNRPSNLIPVTDRTPPSAETIGKIDAIEAQANEMRLEMEARRAAKRQIVAEAKSEWEAANPNVSWDKLTKSARFNLIREVRIRRATQEAVARGQGDEGVVTPDVKRIATEQLDRWKEGAKALNKLVDGDIIQTSKGLWQRSGDQLVELDDAGALTSNTIAIDSIDALDLVGSGVTTGGFRRATRPTSGKETVGVTFDESLTEKLGKSMYNEKHPGVAVKELTQNAVDVAEDNPNGGRVSIFVNQDLRTIQVSDNGSGMTPEKVKNAWLRLGSESKDASLKRGGFGLAKAGFLGGADKVELITIAKDKDGSFIRTVVQGSGDDWAKGKMKLEWEVVPPTETGTIVNVQFPKEAQEHMFNASSMAQSILSNSSIPNVRIEYSLWSDRSKTFVPMKDWDDPIHAGNSIVSDVKIPGANLRFYRPIADTDVSWGIQIPFRIRGLYQGSGSVQYEGLGPEKIIVDIEPTVHTTHDDYPFITNREQVKSEVTKAVANEVQRLIMASRQKDVVLSVKKLVQPVKTKDGYDLVSSGTNVDEAVLTEIAKRDYVNKFGAAILDATRRLFARLNGTPPYPKLPPIWRVGLSGDGRWLGVNYDIGKLHKAAMLANLDPSILKLIEASMGKPQGNVILINPWRILHEFARVGEPLSARRLAKRTIGTISHEIAHQLFDSHGADHNGLVTRYAEEMMEGMDSFIAPLEKVWQEAIGNPLGADPSAQILMRRGIGQTTDGPIWKDISLLTDAWENGGKDALKRYGKHASAVESARGQGRPDDGLAQDGSVGRNQLRIPERTDAGVREQGVTSGSDVERTAATRDLLTSPESAGINERPREEVNKELTKDLPEVPKNEGVILYAHPAVTGFAGGFALGLTLPADNEEERARHALYLAIAGAGVGSAARALAVKNLRKSVSQQLPPFVKAVQQHLHSVEDDAPVVGPGFFTRFRRAMDRVYAGTIRGSLPVERAAQAAGTTPATPVMRSPAKLAEIFGLFRTMANNWMFDGPHWVDQTGNPIDLGAPSYQQIVAMVDGDVKGLGELAAAMRSLELAAQGKPRKFGWTLQDARQLAATMAQKYHDALPSFRAFGQALARVGNMEGIISNTTFQQWSDAYWAPMQKVLDQPKVAATGKRKIQNPAEAMVEMVPRMLRAAELNRLLRTLFDTIDASPNRWALVGEGKLVQPIGKGRDPHDPQLIQMAMQLKKDIADAGGTMTLHEAEKIVNSMSDRTLNITDDIVRFKRNGETEAWRVSKEMAVALRHLQASEVEEVFRGLGFPVMLNDIAKVGVTGNPVFIFKQAFRDNFQYYMNGTYGTVPVLSQIRPFIFSLKGYKNIVTNSLEYQRYKAVGGGSDNIASQGLHVIEGKAKVIQRLREPVEKNLLIKAAKEFKHGSIRQAYADLMSPIADAGRVGAYLFERGRGKSVIDAVYAAKKAGANYNQRGSFLAVRALNRMTLFLNPSFASVDATKDAIKTNPFAYMLRAVMGIMLPSAWLWAAFQDDEEVQEARRGPAGDRNWVVRINGEITLIPKPILDGQLWGTSMEKALDNWLNSEPYMAREWANATIDDASINLIPTIGVIPLGLATNKVPGLGSDITPGARERAQTEFQSRPTTSTLARIVGGITGPMADATGSETLQRAASPAGIEFMIRSLTGGLGDELVRGASQLLDYVQKGYIPAKEDMMFVHSAFPKSPSMSAGSVREFYTTLHQVQKIGTTLNIIIKTKPERVGAWIENNRRDFMLAGLFTEQSRKIADLRKAIIDIQEAPADVMDQETRRQLEKLFTEQIIMLAKAANEVAKSVPDER